MTDLEALVVAAYVFADEYPVPARGGRKPLISDPELVALSVAQAAIGISSDRQFLGLIGRVLPGWFPHLPDQSQYNRRLRGLVEVISIVQQRIARWLDSGGARLSDGTLIGVANYPGCQHRSEFAGIARFGFAKSQHRFVYGVRLVLLTDIRRLGLVDRVQVRRSSESTTSFDAEIGDLPMHLEASIREFTLLPLQECEQDGGKLRSVTTPHLQAIESGVQLTAIFRNGTLLALEFAEKLCKRAVRQ
jgi:hypothetical protein